MSIARTKGKINHLNKEKEVVYNLIKELQKDYFEKQKIAENSYKIKIKKYGEIIRDINRQIPLLQAELEKKKRSLRKKGVAVV
jgi:hypothetical protein